VDQTVSKAVPGTGAPYISIDEHAQGYLVTGESKKQITGNAVLASLISRHPHMQLVGSTRSAVSNNKDGMVWLEAPAQVS
jgi:hypothetical protein